MAGSEEELIGGEVHGAGASWYRASVSGPVWGENWSMYFLGTQSNGRWGVFTNPADCPAAEEHMDVTQTVPVTSEQHCGYNGIYSVIVTGEGKNWIRSIAMLGRMGVPDSIAHGYHDVNVAFDHSAPATELQGALRRSLTYQGEPEYLDTAAYTVDSAIVVTGSPVWFISTYQAMLTGSVKYGFAEISNSFNFDYTTVGSLWWPGVNSITANDPDRRLPYRHIFRSPGRERRLAVVARVIEPYHLADSDGRIADVRSLKDVAVLL